MIILLVLDLFKCPLLIRSPTRSEISQGFTGPFQLQEGYIDCNHLSLSHRRLEITFLPIITSQSYYIILLYEFFYLMLKILVKVKEVMSKLQESKPVKVETKTISWSS